MTNTPGFADSAGQPWAGRRFEPNASADDDGSAPPALLAAIARFREDATDVRDVVRVFRASRLLIPLLTVLGESAVNGQGRIIDKSQELSIVTVEGPDGRSVLPVFSSVAAMNAWNEAARPVPVSGARVALAAASEATELVVLDPVSETQFAIRRPALWAMAQDREWIPGYLDPEVAREFASSVLEEAAVLEAGVTPGDPEARLHGPELMIRLLLLDGLNEGEIQSLVTRLTEAWSRSELIAERVDSIGVSLHSAGELSAT